MKKKSSFFKKISISIIWLWLGIFALTPIALTFITSFLTQDPNSIVKFIPTTSNYVELFNHAYLSILLQSLYLASGCTIISLIIGYPFAFIIARSQSKHRSLLLLLVIIPFWTSSLIRTYAVMAILKAKGILNTLLLAIGLIDQPMQILYSHAAVLIGCVYDLLPFMILPLYANIEKLNQEYLEAAEDLGANWFTTFVKVVIPLTMPGIIAGSVLVFLPAMTMFYIPVLLGGAKNLLIGNLIEYQFLTANNWPLGTAISIVITLLMGIFILIYWHNSKEKDRESLA
ncbi:MAG: Putrescine transport system permease protein PotH [uncultured bacterium]|nr:MAG: Putrescine transport system permease protein PotH [uncultured bacterium]OGT08767.1 MAG: spermidine/putrescine ABC transporter permease [Gammaproteobacteria bacterium RBG_16_37_9]HBC71454.1 spermidine/putrescine ABC transporter permease PotB [Coxiellaceae bacterium]HBS51805.1 spermidine/putrescine ABC transporter permease PotB [Coxiellaceae bacterium]HBY55907.1 spermidine/putrescine ABC transporter permease PotB [Coxiellaceae bacterium]